MKPDGYLPIAVIANFPRIKNMTQDLSVVIKGIQVSNDLELSGDSTCVRTKLNPSKWPIEDENIKELPPPNSSKFVPIHAPGSVMMAYGPPILPIPVGAFSPPIVVPIIPVPVPVLARSPGSEMLNPNVPEFVPLHKVPIEEEEKKDDNNDNQNQTKKENPTVSTAKKPVEIRTEHIQTSFAKTTIAPTPKPHPEVEVSWQEVKKKPKPVSKCRKRVTSVDGGDGDYNQTQFAFEDDAELAPERTRTYSSSRYSV